MCLQSVYSSSCCIQLTGLGKAGALGVVLEEAQTPRRWVSGPCHAPDLPQKFGQIAGFCTSKFSSIKQGEKTSRSCHGVVDEHIRLLRALGDQIVRCILTWLQNLEPESISWPTGSTLRFPGRACKKLFQLYFPRVGWGGQEEGRSLSLIRVGKCVLEVGESRNAVS